MTTRPLRLTTQRDQPPAPLADQDSATVLSDAIDALAAARTPYWLGDSGVHLHALASLLLQAQQLLPQAIVDARDQELSWDEIGQLLGISASTAARRYRHPRRTGEET